MKNKIVVITGATSGIGKQAAMDLANMGATVIIHGRNLQKTQKTLKQIREKTNDGELDYIYGDLSMFKQIRDISKQLHEKYDHVDVLINNAGVNKETVEFTEDGIEELVAIHVVAPFLLTYYVLDLLQKSNSARIVNVSSMVQVGTFGIEPKFTLEDLGKDVGINGYGITKTCLNMITFELAERLEGIKVTANCLHPGVFRTKMNTYTNVPPTVGSKTLLHVASSKELEGVSGKYFKDKLQNKSAEISYDLELRKALWEKCEELTGITYSDVIKR